MASWREYRRRLADWILARHARRSAISYAATRRYEPSRLSAWASMHASDAGRQRAEVECWNVLRSAKEAERVIRAAISPPPHRHSDPIPYLGAYGIRRQAGVYQLPKPTPFAVRRFSETPPARRCIEKIKTMVLSMPWDVEPADPKLLKSEQGRRPELPFEMRQRIRAAKRALRSPNETDTFSELLGAVVEDVLVGGFGCIEQHKWDNPFQPFRLWAVDGMSIRINLEWESDNHPDERKRFRYAQFWSFQAPTAAEGFVKFLDRELIYIRYAPRSFTPFGLGPCEVAFEMINDWIGTMEARARKEANDIPEFGINLGEDAEENEVHSFREYWRNEIEGRGAIPILGGRKDPSVLIFRPPMKGQTLDAWPEMILRHIAISFGLSPQTLGLERDVNRSTAEVAQSEEFADAVEPVLRPIEERLHRDLFCKLLGWPDLTIRFTRAIGDDERRAQVAAALYNAGVVVLDEAREKAGLAPLPESDERGHMTSTEAHVAAQIKAQQAAQQAAAGAMGMLGADIPPEQRLGMEEEAAAQLPGDAAPLGPGEVPSPGAAAASPGILSSSDLSSLPDDEVVAIDISDDVGREVLRRIEAMGRHVAHGVEP